MDTSPLAPEDARVQYTKANVRGKTYEYMIGQPPQGPPLGTVLLVHGFPDIPFGWRVQVPYLMSLGFRVIVPSMLGYAGTDAPQDVKQYTLKNVSADLSELVVQIIGNGQQIILGGHDWGGALAWRMAEYHPELVKAVFVVCTPYMPAQKTFFDIDTIVANRLPNFAYQLQFRGPEVEARIQSADEMRQFFAGMYAGLGAGNETGFDPRRGLLFDKLSLLGRPRLLSEAEYDNYVRQYMRQPAPPLRGPLNWYRTRRFNFEDELALAQAGSRIEMPALFISATKDVALPPSMSVGMEKHFKQLSRGEVKASHWALTQAGTEVNGIIGKWINNVEKGALKASL